MSIYLPLKAANLTYLMWLCMLLGVLGCLVKVDAQKIYTLDQVQQGKVVLMNGDTIEGKFNVNLTNDLLQLDRGQTIQSLSARQVFSFSFFDRENQETRFFFSLPFAFRGGYRVPVFFELQYAGQAMSLYTRESLVMDNVPFSDPFTGRTVYSTRSRISFDFYLRDDKGVLVRFTGRKKELLQRLAKQAKPLKQFMKENKLDPSERTDLMRIIEFYNDLQTRLNPTENAKEKASDSGK